MFYLKKRRKQMIALCLSAALSVGSLTAYAATEYWNDASTKPMVETKTPISDNTNWEQWKATRISPVLTALRTSKCLK